ncbi:DUF1961 family protein [Mesobacillus foraminis]|uniref:DUF1961 family protein n=1 Tax=Mesobacillus foraminis TaxID=279826 RepID=UPI001BE5B4B0|nr:DUF1961 family protein [Mesobacillus foraminis]MBT2755549.1 DUF1961 family protein [Mesobacillus foraminis]
MVHSHFFERGNSLYSNSFSFTADIADWKLEGKARTSFEENRLILENELSPSLHGDNAHWVLWCPVEFPDKVMIEWEFYPIREPGLCMIFFSAKGRNGEDLFSSSLSERNGRYPQYHSGDINALHLSYFRHKHADERAFRTCNLRKSHGFHLAAMGADPLPPAEDAISPYHMRLVKYEGIVQFSINDLPVLEWVDDGKSYGEILSGGKIGFRQMAPMKAAYSNFRVHEAVLVNS